jgi:hypothetical protein
MPSWKANWEWHKYMILPCKIFHIVWYSLLFYNTVYSFQEGLYTTTFYPDLSLYSLSYYKTMSLLSPWSGQVITRFFVWLFERLVRVIQNVSNHYPYSTAWIAFMDPVLGQILPGKVLFVKLYEDDIWPFFLNRMYYVFKLYHKSRVVTAILLSAPLPLYNGTCGLCFKPDVLC